VSVFGASALVAGVVSASAAPLTHPDNTWVQLGAIPEPLTAPVFALAVSPTDPATVLVGTGGGEIYRSLDGGATWTETAHGLGHGVLTIQYSPFKAGALFAGSRDAGLWRSGDGGATWTRDQGLPSTTVRTVGFAKSITLVGTDAGLYASRDGATWSPYLSFTQLSLSAIAVAAVNDPAKLLAGADTSRGSEVLPLYMSVDGGGTWNPVKSLGSSTMVASAAAGAVPPGAQSRPVVVGTNAGAFMSPDGGGSWSQLGGVPAVDFTSVSFQANHPERFYLASDGGGGDSGGLWATGDSGASFRSLSAPIPSVTALALSAEDAPTVYAATFRAADHAVMLWAYHDAGGTPVPPAGGVPAAAVPIPVTSAGARPAPASATGLVGLLTSSETPYILLGGLALLVLLSALTLQVRRGREK
jgi:photosystem II stability/assembly factor-like uncharacterized protein